jgi:hypothetical protein
MIKCIIFHSKINQIPLLFILLLTLIYLSITNCKPGLTDNVCDTTSESNQNTILLKQLIGDNSPFCGVSLSNTNNQSESSGNSSNPSASNTPVFYIYTNSITVNGNLGSRATSSNSCQTMQTTSFSSLTCTNHMAVVSYSGDPLVSGGVPASRPLIATGGMIVAPDWNTFITGPLTNSLNGAGVASSPPTPFYWTSTTIGGNYNTVNADPPTSNCNNNTDGTNIYFGTQGAITSTINSHISFAVNQPCDGSTNSAYLVCVCWN